MCERETGPDALNIPDGLEPVANPGGAGIIDRELSGNVGGLAFGFCVHRVAEREIGERRHDAPVADAPGIGVLFFDAQSDREFRLHFFVSLKASRMACARYTIG